MNSTVLVVDDEPRVGQMLEKALPKHGFSVAWTSDPREALERLREEDYELLVADFRMPGLDGAELCRRALEVRSDLRVVVITAFGSLDTAVEAIRAGAYDFVTKPFEIDGLALVLRRAAEHRALCGELRRLRRAVATTADDDGLLGSSDPIQRIRDITRRTAPSDVSVLVTGESGTGKELVARAIHRQSLRAEGPFVSINCAALPEALLESELFGHRKGAFTDAHVAREGLFFRARGGTLFLDEVAELPLGVQPKLLRAIQERRVRPVGADDEVDVDVRLIAATHQDLEERVRDGRFREDLFYRIDVVHIALPPLRARSNDVLLLAQHFLEKFAATHRRPVESISPAAAAKLLAYDWPGNVRELANCIERAVALAPLNEISLEDLPERVRDVTPNKPTLPSAPTTASEVLTLDEVQKRYALSVLELVGGNKREAARLLGMDRATLYRWLGRFSKTPELR